ncbi:hypothetical protein AAMO2058_000095700 [Amorphochlora amoebiformis]
MRERSKRAISPGKSQVVSPNSNWTKSASRGGGKDKEYGAESEGGSYSEHLLAILIGAAIYILVVRPLLTPYYASPPPLPAETRGLESKKTPSLPPIDVNLNMGVEGGWGVCMSDFWCYKGQVEGSPCFRMARASQQRDDERLIEYTCSKSPNKWLSYAKDKASGEIRIGLWRKKQNAIPFRVVSKSKDKYRLQSMYPASGYGLWLSVSKSKDQPLILVKDEAKSHIFTISQTKGEVLSGGLGVVQSVKKPHKTDSLDPASLKRYRYIGCYKDSYDRDLTGTPAEVGPRKYAGRHQGYDVASCGEACKSRGFKFFSLQAYTAERKSFCFCGDSYGNGDHRKVDDFECGAKDGCGIGPCGENQRNAVYGYK